MTNKTILVLSIATILLTMTSATGYQIAFADDDITSPALYGSDNIGNIFLFDPSVPAITQLGNTGASFGSTEIECTDDGICYSQQRNGGLAIEKVSFNPPAVLGPPLFDGFAFNGLEYVGNTLYGTAILSPCSESILSTLDPETGESVLIGPTLTGRPMSGLAYDQENEIMYGVDGCSVSGPSNLYTVNLYDGSATPIGNTSVTLGSLEFGPDGILYAGGDSNDGGNIYKIDTDSAASEFIISSELGSVTGLTLADISPFVDIPTYIISNNPTGGQCNEIGKWNPNSLTCKLNSDQSAHLTIESDDTTVDCDGHSITGNGLGNGVDLSGRSGVTVKNCNVEEFSIGINLASSNDNTLNENTISSNVAVGIQLSNSNYNILKSNTVTNNSPSPFGPMSGGIIIESSNYNTVMENKVNENIIGIALNGSNDNTLKENIASDNTFAGIILLGSNNLLKENIANGNNGFGFFLDTSSDNEFKGNTANDNVGNGFLISNSFNNEFKGNTANGNSSDGFFLISLLDNEFKGNTANDNVGNGFLISNSFNNEFKGNTANGNSSDGGFFLQTSSNNKFNENTANGNTNGGFFLQTSSNNEFKGNTANGNNGGFQLIFSSNNKFNENTANDNNLFGFTNFFSSNNEFNENTANDNGIYGYFDLTSGTGTAGTDNTYKNNKCENNGSGGIPLPLPDPPGGSSPPGLCTPQV